MTLRIGLALAYGLRAACRRFGPVDLSSSAWRALVLALALDLALDLVPKMPPAIGFDKSAA